MGLAFRRRMEELPEIVAPGDVREEVERLPGQAERLLQRVVVARRDDELVARPSEGLLDALRHLREEVVERRRLVVAEEDLAQALVQGTGALHRRLVLRYPHQVLPVRQRVVELAREVLRELPPAWEAVAGRIPLAGACAQVRAGAQERDDLAVHEGLRDAAAVVGETGRKLGGFLGVALGCLHWFLPPGSSRNRFKRDFPRCSREA